MEEQFIPYEQALALKELGFNQPCFGSYEREARSLTPSVGSCQGIFNNTDENQRFEWKFSAPLWQQAFDWFEDKFQLSSILYIQYPYKNSPNTYWTFGITDKDNESIIDPNDRFGDLLEECHQDIPGNYLNQEKFNELIFTSGYAFKTRTEVRIALLEKLIQIVKNETNTN